MLITAFPELNSNEMSTHLFKFYEIFDGLIGVDNMQTLQIKLTIPNNILITPNSNIKILCIQTSNNVLIQKQIHHNNITSSYQTTKLIFLYSTR